jgi:hypothetical protein
MSLRDCSNVAGIDVEITAEQFDSIRPDEVFIGF